MLKRRRLIKRKTVLSWSSGKDSAWALHLLQQDPTVELVGLFTLIEQKHNRASMHDTRIEMLHRQADAAGLPIEMVVLPDECSNEQYDAVMQAYIAAAARNRVECMAFGDLFVSEIRQYRERQLQGSGISPLFPLWGMCTRYLVETMLAAGLHAHISSVDLNKLPAHLAGKRWSKDVIAGFPDGCHPCGENGEIHTVVVAGPMFNKPIPVSVGAVIERDGFAYADIIPQGLGV
ncbi:ATP-binding protein [Thiothrix subterranea]|uniref:Dph6-related ATP pyrophosphatase n=1 Tax=Thiothrix subterranea TaxID=2735563 RepID=UPI00192B624E|nr:ATP-binding protein [Thiothrix subterranea]QQZ27483.1 ATP-binding protein [Thiothrix subterranea]